MCTCGRVGETPFEVKVLEWARNRAYSIGHLEDGNPITCLESLEIRGLLFCDFLMTPINLLYWAGKSVIHLAIFPFCCHFTSLKSSLKSLIIKIIDIFTDLFGALVYARGGLSNVWSNPKEHRSHGMPAASENGRREAASAIGGARSEAPPETSSDLPAPSGEAASEHGRRNGEAVLAHAPAAAVAQTDDGLPPPSGEEALTASMRSDGSIDDIVGGMGPEELKTFIGTLGGATSDANGHDDSVSDDVPGEEPPLAEGVESGDEEFVDAQEHMPPTVPAQQPAIAGTQAPLDPQAGGGNGPIGGARFSHLERVYEEEPPPESKGCLIQ